MNRKTPGFFEMDTELMAIMINGQFCSKRQAGQMKNPPSDKAVGGTNEKAILKKGGGESSIFSLL